MINCMSNGKDTIIYLKVALIKNNLNPIPFYKNDSVLSEAVQKFQGGY